MVVLIGRHVAVVGNIRTAVESKLASPHKIRDCGFFYNYNI
jgi:hypothetical protein